MAGRRQRNLWRSLLVAVVGLGLALALLVLWHGPANTTHTSQYLTPGTITLPPTAPAVAITPTAR
jgi:hypothetical protein